MGTKIRTNSQKKIQGLQKIKLQTKSKCSWEGSISLWYLLISCCKLRRCRIAGENRTFVRNQMSLQMEGRSRDRIVVGRYQCVSRLPKWVRLSPKSICPRCTSGMPQVCIFWQWYGQFPPLIKTTDFYSVSKIVENVAKTHNP